MYTRYKVHILHKQYCKWFIERGPDGVIETHAIFKLRGETGC